MKPLLRSARTRRSLISSVDASSGKASPLATEVARAFVTGSFLPPAISFFRRSAIDIAGIPYFFARNVAWVVLPLPGGPTRRMIFGREGCAKAMLTAIAANSVVAGIERTIVQLIDARERGRI